MFCRSARQISQRMPWIASLAALPCLYRGVFRKTRMAEWMRQRRLRSHTPFASACLLAWWPLWHYRTRDPPGVAREVLLAFRSLDPQLGLLINRLRDRLLSFNTSASIRQAIGIGSSNSWLGRMIPPLKSKRLAAAERRQDICANLFARAATTTLKAFMQSGVAAISFVDSDWWRGKRRARKKGAPIGIPTLGQARPPRSSAGGDLPRRQCRTGHE